MYRKPLFLIGMALALTATAAQSDNPKITLKLKNATGAEVAEALSRVTGQDLFWVAGADKRESFDWQNVTLANALREFCTRFQVGPPLRWPTNAGVLQLGWTPDRPVSEFGLIRRGPVEFTLQEVQASKTRSLHFGGLGVEDDNSVMLMIRARMPDLDVDAVAGIEGVVARDDQGHLLVPFPYSYDRRDEVAWPDEWRGRINLQGYDLRAHKLAWLEGTLKMFRSVRRRRVEFPWSAAAQGSQDVDGVRVEFHAIGGTEGAGLELTASLRPSGSAASPEVQYRDLSLRLVDTESHLLLPGGGSGGARQVTGYFSLSDRFDRFVIGPDGRHVEAPPVKHTPAHLVVTYLECRDPYPLVSFRMTNIPLPGSPKVPVLPKPGLEPHLRMMMEAHQRRAPEPPPPPFYDEKGGGFSSRMEFPGRIQPAGELLIGLSRWEHGARGSVRWYQTVTATDASFHRDALAPGKYRVLRKFKPSAGASSLKKGRWLNEETTVEIAAGKVAPLPPLRWLPATRGKPTGEKP